MSEQETAMYDQPDDGGWTNEESGAAFTIDLWWKP